MTAKDKVIDVRAKDESADFSDICKFTADVALGSIFGLASGVVDTVSDVAQGGLKLCQGDVDSAGQIVKNRAHRMIDGVFGAVESTVTIGKAGVDALTDDADFMTEANKAHLIRIGQLGLGGTIGSVMMGESATAQTCSLDGDACDLPGVENGEFKGSDADLQALIKAGEVEGTTHVNAEDIERRPATIKAFEEAHDMERVPGMEYHHIQPLSEEGEDSVENLVRVDEETHDKITAAHAEFYDWKKKS